MLWHHRRGMTDLVFARVLHLLAIVLWIGGVGMVTLVLLPAIRRYQPAERFAVFHRLEARFAQQARLTTALAGASGLYMVWRLDAWSRFGLAGFWWMHSMVLTWVLFTAMLFVLEPLFLERWLTRRSMVAPESTYHLIEWLHRVLLGLSLLTVAGAAAGTVGGNLFDW